MYERFTDRLRKVLNEATTKAWDTHSPEVYSIHVLWALAKDANGLAGYVLRDLGFTEYSFHPLIATFCNTQDKRPEMGKEVKEYCRKAAEEAKLWGHTYVGTEHMLLVMRKDWAGEVYRKSLEIENKLRELIDPPPPLVANKKEVLTNEEIKKLRETVLMQSIRTRTCDICLGSVALADKYGTNGCPTCGQKYDWTEGMELVLSVEQLELLRKQWQEKKEQAK